MFKFTRRAFGLTTQDHYSLQAHHSSRCFNHHTIAVMVVMMGCTRGEDLLQALQVRLHGCIHRTRAA